MQGRGGELDIGIRIVSLLGNNCNIKKYRFHVADRLHVVVELGDSVWYINYREVPENESIIDKFKFKKNGKIDFK